MDTGRFLAVLCCFLLCSCAGAQHLPESQQSYSRVDIFGGYSYLNADLNNIFSLPRQGVNGWELSFSLNAMRWVGWESELSGYYKTTKVFGQMLGINDHSFVSGPRLNFRPLFVHALLGVDHLKGSAIGTTLNQDSITGVFGGGIQWPLTSHLSARSSIDYVFSRHNLVVLHPVTQDNFRAGAGIVFSFGGPSRTVPKTRTEEVTASGTPIPKLGVIVVPVPEDGGSKIVDIAPTSVAAKAGLSPGDIINTVDGNPARSPMELSAQLTDQPAGGHIKLGYLSRGYWQTNALITLP